MIRTLLTIATSALLCSCLISVNPLSSPAEASPDERLFGVWVLQDEDDGGAYLHVGRGEQGMTEALMIEHRQDGTYKTFRYRAFPTKLGEQTFLNVVSPDDHKDRKGYDIVRYQVDGKRLSIALMTEAVVKADIAAGKLKGKVEKGEFGDVTITASNEELRAYLQAADPAKLFPKPARFLKQD